MQLFRFVGCYLSKRRVCYLRLFINLSSLEGRSGPGYCFSHYHCPIYTDSQYCCTFLQLFDYGELGEIAARKVRAYIERSTVAACKKVMLGVSLYVLFVDK